VRVLIRLPDLVPTPTWMMESVCMVRSSVDCQLSAVLCTPQETCTRLLLSMSRFTRDHNDFLSVSLAPASVAAILSLSLLFGWLDFVHIMVMLNLKCS